MNKNKKSPINHKPLRNPGQSLDEKIESLIGDKAVLYGAMIMIPIVLAGMDWHRHFLKFEYSPWVYTVVAIISSIYGVFKLTTLRNEVKKLRQGRDGERAVGQFLESLRKNDCRIFHDIIGNGFNIDHVVISTKGIFAVETKTYSKPVKGEAVVLHQNSEIIVDGYNTGAKILNQTKAGSGWLKEMFKDSLEKDCFIKPVILFPGWYIKNASSDTNVWILNPKAFPAYIEKQPDRLSYEEVGMYSSCLIQYVRNN